MFGPQRNRMIISHLPSLAHGGGIKGNELRRRTVILVHAEDSWRKILFWSEGSAKRQVTKGQGRFACELPESENGWYDFVERLCRRSVETFHAETTRGSAFDSCCAGARHSHHDRADRRAGFRPNGYAAAGDQRLRSGCVFHRGAPLAWKA